MKVESLNNDSVKDIIAECQLALQAVADKFGLELKRKGCRYGQMDMPVPFTLQCTTTDKDGNTIDKDGQEFKDWATIYGLDPSDLGKTFKSGTASYKIVGLKRRNRKYPIVAKNLRNGKTYKFPTSFVKAGLKD